MAIGSACSRRCVGPNPPKVVVTSIPALLQPVPSRERLAEQTRTLRIGEPLSVDEISRWLVESGFQNTTAVELPGEFSHRGGIIDIYAPDWFNPVRIELFGDEIESIRQFEAASQRSLERVETIEITAAVGAGSREQGAGSPERGTASGEQGAGSSSTPRSPLPAPRSHLADYLPPRSWFLLVEPGELESESRHYLDASNGRRDSIAMPT